MDIIRRKLMLVTILGLKGLKTKKKFKTVNPNSDRARLSEMDIYESFEGEDFNWKILVF